MGVRRRWRHFAISNAVIVVAVGLTASVFSIANAVWLRPKPFTDPSRIVVVLRRSQPLDGARFSDRALGDLAASGLFEHVAGQVVTRDLFSELRPAIQLTGASAPVETLGVTPEYFSTLGVAVRGRDISSLDDQIGVPLAGIISDRVWKNVFHERPDVIGSTLAASPEPVTIIGIAAPEFHGALLGEDIDLWIPHHLVPRVSVVGQTDILPMIDLCRLRSGLSVSDAQAILAGGLGRLSTDFTAVPVSQLFASWDSPMVVFREQSLFLLLSIMSGLVLAVGCATLFALILADLEQQRGALAIHLALGAGRARLIAQLAGELAVLWGVGSAGAVVASRWLVEILPRFQLANSIDFGRLTYELDWRVLAGAAGACLLTIAGAAILPLARYSRAEIARHLLGAHATSDRTSVVWRQRILTLHVAASLGIAVTAGLFIRTVQHGASVAAGFDARRTLFVSLRVANFNRGSSDAGLINAPDVIERLRALPHVSAVAIGPSPLGARRLQTLIRPTTLTIDGQALDTVAGTMSADAGYYSVVRARFLSGGPPGPGEAVVSSALAEDLWPGQSPIGHSLAAGGFRGTVAGVVDLAYGSVKLGSVPFAAFAEAARPSRTPALALAMRADDPAGVRDAARAILREVPAAVETTIVTGTELLEHDLARERMGAWFFTEFGLVTCLLAAGSVFGVVAAMVQSRRREFGIRLALGARPSILTRLALWSGIGPAAAGVVLGTAITIPISWSFQSFLLGVSAVEPMIYAVCGVGMLGLASLAGWLAAVRLRRLSPVDVLRRD